MPDASRKSPKPQRSNGFLRYAGMATQMAVVIGLGVWAGRKLDHFYPNEMGVWTLVLSVISVFLAVYLVIRDLLKS